MSITGPRMARPTRSGWRWSTCSPACTRPPPCSPRCTGARGAASRCRCSTAAWRPWSTWPRTRWSPGGTRSVTGTRIRTSCRTRTSRTPSATLLAAANDGLFRGSASARPSRAGRRRALCHERGRVERRRELIPLLQERLRERPADEWVEALRRAGVPVGKVRSVPEALAAAARPGVRRPCGWTTPRGAARPRGLADVAGFRQRAFAPPLLGEHTPRCCASSGERKRRSRSREPQGGAQCGSSALEAGGRDSSASEVIVSRPRAACSITSVASSEERA